MTDFRTNRQGLLELHFDGCGPHALSHLEEERLLEILRTREHEAELDKVARFIDSLGPKTQEVFRAKAQESNVLYAVNAILSRPQDFRAEDIERIRTLFYEGGDLQLVSGQ